MLPPFWFVTHRAALGELSDKGLYDIFQVCTALGPNIGTKPIVLWPKEEI
jgi:hypothetical protein